MNHNNQEWKTIEEFPNYEISSDCKIRNKKTGYIMNPGVGTQGYRVVMLTKDRRQYLRKVHRLFAIAYLPNPYNKPCINHIDGNKDNNSLNNLEWVTRKENNIHAHRTGLHPFNGDKPVVQYDINGNYIKTYKSGSEAGRVLNICEPSISAVARGCKRVKTAGGFIWRFEKDVKGASGELQGLSFNKN